MALTETKIKMLKVAEGVKRERYTDVDGLVLEVTPKRKIFRFRYVDKAKKQCWHKVGEWPVISLREAREKCLQLRRNLVRDEAIGTPEGGRPFKEIVDEFMAKKEKTLRSTSIRSMTVLLKTHILPALGNMPIQIIKPVDVLKFLRVMEEADKVESAHKARGLVSQIFRYAVACQYCETDPAQPLIGALTSRASGHFAALTHPDDIGKLMRAIDGYAQPTVRNAMYLSAYTFVRPGELRGMKWCEINLSSAEWKIPAERMKMKRIHIVPLPTQAVRILNEQMKVSGEHAYVFPANYGRDRPMSENTVLAALRMMGFTKDQMTPHGFRGMASTVLNEHGFNRDHIERQLGHVQGNAIRAAYNHAEYLAARRQMVQWYADYLDGLRDIDPFFTRRVKWKKAEPAGK